MAMGNVSVPGQLQCDVNVTPMVDVLLVLLIIFMVIVPVTPRGLQAALPHRSGQTNSAMPLVLQITAEPAGKLRYILNQQDISIDNLHDRLTSVFSTRADRVLFVKADDKLDFSTIASVMDVARSSGAAQIGLLTSKDAL